MQVMKQKKQTVVRSLDYWRDQSTHRCDGGAMFTQLTNIFNDLYYLSFSAQAPCLDCLITPSWKLLLAFLSLVFFFF